MSLFTNLFEVRLFYGKILLDYPGWGFFRVWMVCVELVHGEVLRVGAIQGVIFQLGVGTVRVVRDSNCPGGNRLAGSCLR